MKDSLDGAERVRAWMLERGVPGELIRPGDPTPTVESAAAALGVKPEQVIKSLLFLVDGSPYLVIVRGTARVDTARLLQALGAGEARLGKKAEVEAITGFPVGGTPPFGHRQTVPVLIDRGVLDLEEIYAGGGADDVMLRLKVAALLQATHGRLLDVI
ncbi:MAG: YbaK/EbsC family protein [candidate division NC10 bacterium]|nr:YbaK/EbsC family protein [candidate division NC10 bacterium]